MDSLLVALAIDLLGVQCVSLSRKAFEILDKTFRFLEEFLLETNCSVVFFTSYRNQNWFFDRR